MWGMDLGDAIRSGGALVGDRGRSVLPLYLLAAGVPVVARAPLFLAVALAIGWLRLTGRVAPALREFERATRTVPPGTPPSALGQSVADLLSPSVLALVGVGAGVSLGLLVLARSVATAGTLAGVYGALCGDDATTAGIRGMANYWRPFLGLTVLRLVALVIAAVPALVGVGAGAGIGFRNPVGVAVAALGVLVGVGLFLLVELALAFAGQAIVVDDAGTVGALGRSLGLVVRRPVDFGAFLGVAIVVATVSVGTLLATSAIGAGRVGVLILTVVVTPAFDGFKTALYAERTLPAVERAPPGERVVSGVRTGVEEAMGFVRERPGAVLASAGLLTVGVTGGWLTTAHAGVRFDAPADPASLLGGGAALEIAANNWLVGASTAYAGLAFGVGTAVGLLFNGWLVGALSGLFDPAAVLALVAPHGVVELPAIAVAGGVGLHLGRVGWQGWRGRQTPGDVATELRRALTVLVGLAVPIVVAAVLEAFLTPLIAGLVLGAG